MMWRDRKFRQVEEELSKLRKERRVEEPMEMEEERWNAVEEYGSGRYEMGSSR